MYSKIEKSFQNSQFYRNYNNVDFVILKFRKIKNKYTESKNKYKNDFLDKINMICMMQFIQFYLKIISKKSN